MAAGKPWVPSKARAVPIGAAMICRGYMTAACEMTRPGKVSAAAAHMPNRSVAAADGMATPSRGVASSRGMAAAAATTTTAMLRQCRSRARQNQS